MISKPLLKQSIKANGISWLLVTVATSLMLGIIIIVLGNLQANEIRDSLRDTFIESELEANFKGGAIDSYLETYNTTKEVYPNAKDIYDLTTGAITLYETFKANPMVPDPKSVAVHTLVNAAEEDLKEKVALVAGYVLDAYEEETISSDKLHEFKCGMVIELILANMDAEMGEEAKAAVTSISREILDLYAINNELTDEDLQTVARLFIEEVFYSNLVNTETDEKSEMLSTLGFASMEELLEAYGFTELKVNTMISSGLIQFISFVNNEMPIKEAREETTGSLLSQMPEKVGSSLQELGEMNINHLVIGTIFYKIAGLLLPMVYVIMTANNLIAGQVDSGSLAFVLSTPTKRRKVAVTQMVFMLGSLVLMYLLIGGVGLLASIFVEGSISISSGGLMQLTLGALVTMIAFSGICFLASAWFNRSKNAMGVGGGISMFFLVSTILGLFGSKSIPKAMQIEAMNFFNYTSIISFFNVKAILEGGTYLWGLLILLAIAAVTYTIGIFKFDRKDLPL